MPGPSDALSKPKANNTNVYAQKVVVKQAGRASFSLSLSRCLMHNETCLPLQLTQLIQCIMFSRGLTCILRLAVMADASTRISGTIQVWKHNLCMVLPAESNGRSAARHAKAEIAAARIP